MEVVTAIRSIRGEMNVSPAKKIVARIAASEAVRAELESQQRELMSLARLESLEWLPEDANVDGAAVAPLFGATVFLPLKGLVDVAEELSRIEKNVAKVEKDVAGLEGRLSNQKFVDSAPEAVVAKVRSDLDENRAKLEELKAAEARLKAL
jgi:valyl-tRNA synthetase